MQWFCQLLSLVLVATSTTLCPAADEDPKERFLSAYEPEVPVLIAQYVKNREMKILQTKFEKNGEKARTYEIHIVSSDTSIRVRRQLTWVREKTAKRDDSTTKEEEKRSQERDEGDRKDLGPTVWAIFRPDASYEIVGPKANSRNHVLTYFGEGGPFAMGASRLRGSSPFAPPLNATAGMFFPERVRQSGCQVLSLSPWEWRGRKLTRLECRETTFGGVVNKSFYFDSDNHWLFCGEESKGKDQPETYVTLVEYEAPRDGFARLRKVESYHEYSDSPPWLTDRFEYVQFERAHPDASEFSLAQFGLSDPKPPAEPPVLPGLGLHIWLIGAGLLTAAMAIAMYTLATRKPKTAKPA